jgi:hypothetical protein
LLRCTKNNIPSRPAGVKSGHSINPASERKGNNMLNSAVGVLLRSLIHLYNALLFIKGEAIGNEL